MPCLLYAFLSCLGIISKPDQNFRSKIKGFVFGFLLYFGIVELIFLYINDIFSITFALWYFSIRLCSIMLWHCMRANKGSFRKIFRSLQLKSCTHQLKKLNFATFLIVCVNIIYCLSNTLLPFDMKTFGYEPENIYFKILLRVFNYYLEFLTYPGLACVVALFYCASCLHCSYGIQNLTYEINKLSDDSFTTTVQIRILKRKMKIDRNLDDIQAAFSVPSFLVIASGFLSCSYALGSVITAGKYNFFVLSELIKVITTLILSCSSMIGTLWVAGGIPIALNKLKEAFYRKAHSRYIFHLVTEDVHLKRELLEKPDFVLSGCDVVSYRRSSILVLVGTLFTYSVLVIQASWEFKF